MTSKATRERSGAPTLADVFQVKLDDKFQERVEGPQKYKKREDKKAMKAFRRRVKLMKLDMESKLGVGPMSGGRAADFDSIMPPQEFPPEVWATLAAEGRLVATGRGFYKLPES